MSYKTIELEPSSPEIFRHFISRHVDMQLADIHTMLRLPIIESNLNAGCNFAATNCLLDLASGFSTFLAPKLNTRRKSAMYFKRGFRKYYPWDLQPLKSGSIEKTIDRLYYYLRNPLSHSLGLKTKDNFAVSIFKNPLTEAQIEKLEKSRISPGPAIIYDKIVVGDKKIKTMTLDVEKLYWGIREMLLRISKDEKLMGLIERRLKSVGVQ